MTDEDKNVRGSLLLVIGICCGHVKTICSEWTNANNNEPTKNKGWKFLKKLWCCVGGGNKVIWLYQLSWKCKLATVTSYKADVSSVGPSSERMEGLWVVCGFIWRKWSYAIGWNIVTKNKDRSVCRRLGRVSKGRAIIFLKGVGRGGQFEKKK